MFPPSAVESAYLVAAQDIFGRMEVEEWKMGITIFEDSNIYD
jgi:hypothetical protein